MHVRVVSVLFACAALHGVAVANLPDSLDTRSVNQPGGRRFTGIASGIARRLAICPFAIAQSVQYATDLAFCADIAYIACLDLSCTVNAADTVACCKNACCRLLLSLSLWEQQTVGVRCTATCQHLPRHVASQAHPSIKCVAGVQRNDMWRRSLLRGDELPGRHSH